MKKVSIVGFGRFGRVLYRLIKDDFIVTLFNRNRINLSIKNALSEGPAARQPQKHPQGNPVFGAPRLASPTRFPVLESVDIGPTMVIAKDLKQVYQSEVIFFCVPISSFEEVIKAHKKYFREDNLLVDVLSVKLHPLNVFTKYLKGSKTQALLTHPMFGPDSSRRGFAGLPMIIDQFKTDEVTYNFWKEYFRKKKLTVIEMSAREHDKLAASSQGLTHFIGRLLEAIDFKATPIDSLGTKQLLAVKEQTCNDTWRLFSDLQHYNPYTRKMRITLGKKYDKLYNKLLPKQKRKRIITYGIQGGKGSFNEEAILWFLRKNGISKYKIKYLFTCENVLAALTMGDIDYGQFAISNLVGGMVEESLFAMAKYKFKIVNKFAIKISHALMMRKDANLSEIMTIMTHPQVLAQCRDTLLKKYPHLTQTSGEKKLIDQAVVAKYLSEGKLSKQIVTLGSRELARLYDLVVVEDNLQDAKDNYTTFLQVCRI